MPEIPSEDENEELGGALFEVPDAAASPHPESGALFAVPPADDEALFEPEPRVDAHVELSLVPFDPVPRSEVADRRKRAESIARAYCQIRPLMKMATVRNIVVAAIKDGRWTDDEIREAVLHFANKGWRINGDGLEGHLKRASGRRLKQPAATSRAQKPKPATPPRENPLLPQKTAVYRLYDADRTLLYVGKTPAICDRFHEHRDSKSWWKKVAHHSIKWWNTPEQALAKEEQAIKDEWPIHNDTHQPRKGDGYRIPSHVANVILQVVRKGVVDNMPDATEDQIGAIVAHVVDAFDVANSDNQIEPTWGIWFGKSQAPTDLEGTDLDEMRRRMGSLRPEIDGSTRLNPLPELPDSEDGAA